MGYDQTCPIQTTKVKNGTCGNSKQEEAETSAELLHDAMILDRRGLCAVSVIAFASTQDEKQTVLACRSGKIIDTICISITIETT